MFAQRCRLVKSGGILALSFGITVQASHSGILAESESNKYDEIRARFQNNDFGAADLKKTVVKIKSSTYRYNIYQELDKSDDDKGLRPRMSNWDNVATDNVKAMTNIFEKLNKKDEHPPHQGKPEPPVPCQEMLPSAQDPPAPSKPAEELLQPEEFHIPHAATQVTGSKKLQEPQVRPLRLPDGTSARKVESDLEQKEPESERGIPPTNLKMDLLEVARMLRKIPRAKRKAKKQKKLILNESVIQVQKGTSGEEAVTGLLYLGWNKIGEVTYLIFECQATKSLLAYALDLTHNSKYENGTIPGMCLRDVKFDMTNGMTLPGISAYYTVVDGGQLLMPAEQYKKYFQTCRKGRPHLFQYGDYIRSTHNYQFITRRQRLSPQTICQKI